MSDLDLRGKDYFTEAAAAFIRAAKRGAHRGARERARGVVDMTKKKPKRKAPAHRKTQQHRDRTKFTRKEKHPCKPATS